MTSLQTITAEARLDRSGRRVLCGSKQNGRYWCGEVLGWIVESPHELPEPYEENTRRARDLGFDVTTIESATTGEVVERPAVVRRYLRLPDGWSCQRGYWGRGRHAERALGEGRMLSRRPGPLEAPDRVTTRWRTLRWCDPGYLTPDRYPVPAKCPSPTCGLVQMLIADAQHLRLHVHGDISDMPWERGWATPLAGRYLLDMVEVEEVYRTLMNTKTEGKSPPPDRARLLAHARVMTARVTVEARWWHRLGTWAETASLADCRRCLDEATADGPGLRPTFAREFVLRLEQR